MSKRPRVLVADDHLELTKAVCRLLTMDCDVVGTVADGAALLEAAQRLQPDIVVLDLNLPNVHGLEACRRITQAHPETTVIVFTALSDQAVRERALAVGAAAFVSKLASDDLLSAIRRLWDGRGAPDAS